MRVFLFSLAIIINSKTNSVQIGIIFICLIRVKLILQWFGDIGPKTTHLQKNHTHICRKNPRNVQNEHFFKSKRIVFCSLLFVIEMVSEKRKEIEERKDKATDLWRENRHITKKTRRNNGRLSKVDNKGESLCSQQLKKRRPVRDFSRRRKADGRYSLLNFKMRIKSIHVFLCVLCLPPRWMNVFLILLCLARYLQTETERIKNAHETAHTKTTEGKRDYEHLWLMQNKCRIASHCASWLQGGPNRTTISSFSVHFFFLFSVFLLQQMD